MHLGNHTNYITIYYLLLICWFFKVDVGKHQLKVK